VLFPGAIWQSFATDQNSPMTFKFISHQSIKSISQRALAAQWDRMASGRRFPAFTDYTPQSGTTNSKQLIVWNVEGEGRQIKFRALYQGDNITEVFDAAWAGKTMEEVVPMSLRRLTMDPTKECAASGCLVYTIISTIDSNGSRIDCERLLLPFGHDGSKVEQILTSVEFTSNQGEIRRKKILSSFQIQADLIFSGKIKSGFTKVDEAPAPSKQASSDKRRAKRRKVLQAGRITFARQSLTCTVRDISATGAALAGANLATTPDIFMLLLEMESSARRCTVVWRKKTQIGVQFG
jgi:PilZ domain